MARQYIDPAIAQMAETEDGTEERIMAIVARAKKEGTLTPLSRHFEPPKNERGKR